MKPAKRVFDVVATIAGLVVLWPFFLLFALLVKLDDGGPVLYSQERIGLRGRPFRMRKFRTMRVNDGSGSLLTVGGDPRITRVGYWLRKFKLDELPQVLNVLAGDMTLVGPRPEVARYVALYTAEQRRVLDLVPGITDPASIRFWDESELLGRATDPERAYINEIMPEKIGIQLDYGEQATLWTDFLVTLNTLRRLGPTARPVVLDRLVHYRRQFIIGAHVLLVALGYRAAYELRFDFDLPPAEVQLFWFTLPALLLVRLATYARFGLFRGYWQHFGLADLTSLAKAATMSSIGFVALLTLMGAFPGVPRSVLLMDWVGAIFLSGGVRFVARTLKEYHMPFAQPPGRRTLVVGSGDRAERLVREVRREGRSSLRLVGMVAENPEDRDRAIHGVRVLGTADALPGLVEQHRIGLVVIALDDGAGLRMQRVVDLCTAAGVEFKTLPSLDEVLAGTAQVSQLRKVELHDLLGREPVHLDLSRIAADLHCKTVLVTGGAGSIGSELARQIARFHPARLVLLDQAESPLYLVSLEVGDASPDVEVVPIVCDITVEESLSQVYALYRPDYVIHAAAYKHVPLMETNVAEAVRNNVLGTLQVARQAAYFRTGKFVLISSDKAVNPSSVMGATKRIAERLVLGLPELRDSATDFRAVRFGNVLGSNGSVVPIFEWQLAHGGPITITHPDVERYFMTIPEAAQLVLQAAALPEAAGRIAMLDMGRPVRIVDLAEKLIRLSGREPHRDVPIVFTGLRPGEKLHEELISAVEAAVPTSSDKVRTVHAVEENGAIVETMLDRLVVALVSGDEDRLACAIGAFVPECVPPLRRDSGPMADPLPAWSAAGHGAQVQVADA